ncbi:hypothetical protein VTJ49DRAFT_6068 [Mycothermus thermophilus]|uniref:DNL-type domain-containing protein n=1 Tax=Humicola insolens TaxID=85995 RepID=A0ABR3VMF1_HUMIN
MASKRVLTSIPKIIPRFTTGAPTLHPLLSPARRNIHPPVGLTPTSVRLAHSIPRPRKPTSSPFTPSPQTPSSPSSSAPQQQQPDQPTSSSTPPTITTPPPKHLQPHYELTFTCNPCGTRSRHRVSKHGYHKGSVLVACPSCKARHVISDHLKIFGDRAMTVEDILRAKGEAVKRGVLQPLEGNGEEGEEGVVEVWDDGTVTEREPWVEPPKRVLTEEEKNLPPGATFRRVRPGEGKKEGEE